MKTLRHIGIVCSDVRKMVEFYSFIFGAPKKTTVASERGEFITSILRGQSSRGINESVKKPACIKNEVVLQTTKVHYSNNTTIEFLHYIQPTPVKAQFPTPIKMGISHFAVSVNQITSLYNGLCALIGKDIFISEPLLNKEKTALVCFVFDPEGNCIELVEEMENAETE